MWNARTVSIVLPAYNEEKYIRPAVEDFFVDGVVDEVIVVDNNSRDRTAEEASATRARVVRETAQGYGHALRRGLREASGDLVIMAEPDGTFVGRDVLKLLAYADDFEMVCGTRTTRELIWQQANMGWFLRWGNWTVAKMIQVLFDGPSLTDCGCTLRLTHRAALARIQDDLTVGGSHFLPEMVIAALKRGLRVIEVPVNYRGRVGDSKITGSLKGAAHRLSHDRAHRSQKADMSTSGRPEGRPLRTVAARGVSRRAIAAAVVVLAAFALYAPTIRDYFLQDDFGVVALFSTRSLSYIPRWFVMPWTEDIWGYVPDEIRPFPAVSYVVTSWFGASAPEPNHLVNIALHAANGLLVMWIAEAAAGLSLVSAAAAGLIFVVLPIQVESVGWVTGRVDSLPAFFYFASFLLYVRSVRLTDPTGIGGVRLQADYLWSVALFFAALFTKQNTITMVPALVLFDWVVARRRIQISWAWLRPYVPYVVLTVAFLALRYALFHEVARENALSAQRFQEFLSDSSRHLVRLVFGGAGIRHWTWRDSGVVGGVFFVVAIRDARRQLMATPAEQQRPLWRAAVYFGVVWIVLGMAPILVSGYYSPRHMYLASLGWAILLGIGIDVLWRSRPHATGRALAGVLAALALLMYFSQSNNVVRQWSRYAAISHAATTQIEREAIIGPEGTLVIAGVPRLSWAFAVPYSVRPPFTATDLTKRIFVISDSADHCCEAGQWSDYTRGALRGWRDRTDRPPVVALYWNPMTGRMSRVSDRDDPQLRTLAALLLETDSRETLDSAIRGLMNNYVALR
jgi:hypothetical protein